MVMIAGDFLAMSLTTDNVRPSSAPNAWLIGRLTIAGIAMGVGQLAFCVGVLAVGRFRLDLGIDALRTLAFVTLVFSNQAMIYAIRGHRHLWGARPSIWLVASSISDVLIAVVLAIGGIAMAPLSALIVASALVAAVTLTLGLAVVKLPVFARLGLT